MTVWTSWLCIGHYDDIGVYDPPTKRIGFELVMTKTRLVVAPCRVAWCASTVGWAMRQRSGGRQRIMETAAAALTPPSSVEARRRHGIIGIIGIIGMNEADV